MPNTVICSLLNKQRLPAALEGKDAESAVEEDDDEGHEEVSEEKVQILELNKKAIPKEELEVDLQERCQWRGWIWLTEFGGALGKTFPPFFLHSKFAFSVGV